MKRRALSKSMDLTIEQHVVYRVYDQYDYLLYVGHTNNLRKRLETHRRTGSAWMPYAHRYETTGPFDYPTAHELEGWLIYKHKPPYNKRGLLGGVDKDPTYYQRMAEAAA